YVFKSSATRLLLQVLRLGILSARGTLSEIVFEIAVVDGWWCSCRWQTVEQGHTGKRRCQKRNGQSTEHSPVDCRTLWDEYQRIPLLFRRDAVELPQLEQSSVRLLSPEGNDRCEHFFLSLLKGDPYQRRFSRKGSIRCSLPNVDDNRI